MGGRHAALVSLEHLEGRQQPHIQGRGDKKRTPALDAHPRPWMCGPDDRCRVAGKRALA